MKLDTKLNLFALLLALLLGSALGLFLIGMTGCSGDNINATLKATGPVNLMPRAFIIPTNRVRCVTNCPVARSNLTLICGPPAVPQFQWLRLWASTNADMRNQWVWATNRDATGTVFRIPLTNGPHLFFVLAAVDEALPYDSAGRKR